MKFYPDEVKKMIISFLDRIEREVRRTDVIQVDDYSHEIKYNECDFFIYSCIDGKPRFTEGYFHFNDNYVDEIALGKTYETETIQGLSDYDPSIPVFNLRAEVHLDLNNPKNLIDEFLVFTKIFTTNIKSKENLLIPVSPRYNKEDLFPIIRDWNIDEVYLDSIENFASYGDIAIVSLDAKIIIV